jgi:hypothetical protein
MPAGCLPIQGTFVFKTFSHLSSLLGPVKRLAMSHLRFPVLNEIIFFAITDEQVCGACHRKIIVKGKYILCLYYEVISHLLG